MDQNWCKPRKIIHLDQLDKNPIQEEKEFLSAKWKTIEDTVTAYLLQDTKPPSIVNMNRSLQILLVRDKYEWLHQNLIKAFYKIYKAIVNQSFLKNCTLTSLLAYYIHKKHHYRIIFDVLNSYLNSYAPAADKLSIQQKAYKILSKEVLNSPYFDKFNQEFQDIVNQFRISKDQTQILSIQYQLKIVSLLGIYEYFDQQFIERSKGYYVQFAISMTKNEEIFTVIDEAMRREVALNKLLKPSQNTTAYLQKQLIEEYYPFMIEYMEYLIQSSKYDKLRLLWKYTMRLNEQQKQLLHLRFKQIVNDIGKYLAEGEDITKMLGFVANISNIIKVCFDSDKTMFNSLYNTIEETLTHRERQYSTALAKKILYSPQKQSYQIIQQLFKFIPNKQKFIRQLQSFFFKWIIIQNVQNASYQEGIIQIIKKECGITLSRKLQRMLYDIWRDGEMVYYEYRPCNFKCRILSLNDWPRFKYKTITIPDSMRYVITRFENQYKKSPENACKELKWVNQLGTIRMKISGVQSLFSEIQAALIFVLNRSIRPMKQQQLVQIIQGDFEDIGNMLSELRERNILEYNDMNQTYDINDSNREGYVFKGLEESVQEEVSITEKKDNTVIIEAKVVKIMKRKKLLPKTQLTNMLFEQLRTIKPSMQEVNVSIERLANREFIQIDKMKGIIRYKE